MFINFNLNSRVVGAQLQVRKTGYKKNVPLDLS